MKVITLNETEFDKACITLANKISREDELVALVGVRAGGANVAKNVVDYLGKNNQKLKYYEVGASRYATGIKKNDGIKTLFKYVPTVFLDKLRIVEHYMVKIRMLCFYQIDRSITVDEEIINYLSSLNTGKLFVIDDAIDSGATIKGVLRKLYSINSKLEYKVATLVVTQIKPYIFPDVSLFQNVLLRFPWSSDYLK